jgi:hypothetical protein
MRIRQMTGVLLVVALAGCGTATALDSAGHRHRGGPPPGNRAEALRLARHLMAEDPLPPGARRLPQRPVPPGLRQMPDGYGVKTIVDIYRLYALPDSMRRVAAYADAHTPAGMKSGGTSSTGVGGVTTEMGAGFFLNKPPQGISSAGLFDTIVPAPHGGALLRVDAEVTWYPPRSAAEYLVAKSYLAVRIDAWLTTKNRQIRRTFTSRAIIGKLTRLLNGLPASPGGIVPCPLAFAVYTLTFEPAAGQPKVVVNTSYCLADSISVGGVSQPGLVDNGKLGTLVAKLMHVTPPTGMHSPPNRA